MKRLFDPAECRVSLHAWERYCQRVGKIERDEFERLVLADPRIREWLSWGVTGITHVNGLHIYADGRGLITTILRADQSRSQVHSGLWRKMAQRKRTRRGSRRPDPPVEAAE